MPYIEHRYGRTHYQTRGAKRSSGLPIVCLHGGPGGHSRYMTDLFQLSDERRVFLYDQIGGGRSSATKPKRWTIPAFVAELTLLVNAWGLEQFHLFGGSWGTTLALEYYLSGRKSARKSARNNQRVASLLFQSPMFSTSDWEKDANKLIRGLPATERKIIRYCHEIGATDSKVYKDAMTAYYAKHVCRNKAKAKRSAQTKNPNGNKIYAYMWGVSEFHATGTLKNYSNVRSLRHIKCPTLFVCGEYDEAQPATARRYARAVPSAQFIQIKNASHAILAEKPKQLVKTIRSFLARIERDS